MPTTGAQALPRPLRRWRTAALVALLVMAPVACSRGDTPPVDPGQTTGPDAAPAEPEAPGPTLADLLGVGGTPEEVARGIRATETTRQELIRECMAAQGFEYVPHVTAGEVVNLTGLPTHLPEPEFRRRYGYGVATGFENALTLRPQETVDDPNLEILAGMSEAEQAAYERALHGQAGADDAPGGCAGDATRATDRAEIVIAEFGDQLADLTARVAGDSRLVAAERAWADCLAAAGYPFPDEVAIRQEVARRMNPLMESLAGEHVPEGVIDLYRGVELTPEQADLLADARGFELAVAAADQDCREEVDLDGIRATVRGEYEAGFVDDNRQRLRELFPDAGL